MPPRFSTKFAAAAFLCAIAAARADDAESLAPLVVTATRSPQPAFDLPAAIDAVAPDPDARDAGLSQFLAGVPGTLARDRRNYAQDEQISIRGFGARSSFGVRGLRIYQDGIPATMPDGQGQTSQLDFPQAERIEVLRGPFSALYGNSSGGVIQLFTADGAPPASGGLLGGGSYGDARADLYTRGTAGGVDYAVDSNYFRTDGWRAHSAAARWIGNAKLKFTVGSGRVELLASSFDQPEAQDPQGLTWDQYRDDRRAAAPVSDDFNTRKSARQHQGGAVWTQPVNAANTFTLTAYFGQRAVRQFLSVPTLAQASATSGGGVVDLTSLYGGADARWTWRDAARGLEITGGVDAERQNQHRLGYENFVGARLGVQGAKRRDEQDDVGNLDEYVQGQWRFLPRWALSAGVRHSQVRFTTDDHYLASGNPDDSGHKTFDSTSPVAGLVFRPSERWRAYAAYGRGFETPTFNELAYRPDGSAGLNLDLAAAHSDHYELGLKFRGDAGTALQAALFRVDTHDELAVLAASGGRTSYRNLGSTRRRGAELGLHQPLPEHLSLDLACTSLLAQFSDGALLPGVPRQQGHLGLNWSQGEWSAGLAADAVSALNADDAGAARAPGYALLGAQAAFRPAAFAPLSVFVQLHNLADRRYVGSVIVNDANGRYYEPGAGRSAFAGIALRY